MYIRFYLANLFFSSKLFSQLWSISANILFQINLDMLRLELVLIEILKNPFQLIHFIEATVCTLLVDRSDVHPCILWFIGREIKMLLNITNNSSWSHLCFKIMAESLWMWSGLVGLAMQMLAVLGNCFSMI